MQDVKEPMKEKGRAGARRPLIKRETLLILFRELLWTAGSFLLGRALLPLSTYPFGIALAASSPAHVPAVFFGVLLSALLKKEISVSYICVLIALALSRLVLHVVWDPPRDGSRRRPKKRADLYEITSAEADASRPKTAFGRKMKEILTDSLKFRVLLALVSAFVLSLIRIIGGGFRYYDFFAALFLIVVTPLAAFAYGAFLDKPEREGAIPLICGQVLLASLIFGAKTLDLPGFSLAISLGVLLPILLLRRGLAVAVLSASVAGLSYSVSFAPAFLIAVLLFAFSSDLKKSNVGIGLSIAGLSAWAFWIGGAMALLRFLPSGLAAGVGVTVGERFWRRAPEEGSTLSEEGRMHVVGERYRGSNDRFRGISDAFASLSEVFYNLSDRFRRPGTLDLRQICDRSFDHFCPDCPNKTICWGLEYSDTLNTVNNLISALHTKGSVSGEQVPPALSNRCGCMEEILSYMNRECAKLTGELLKNNRTEIFAMDYESAADIIKDALEEDDGEYQFDPELEKKVREYLSDAGVGATSVTVYGNRRRQILVRGVSLDAAKVTTETMRADLGELCGVAFCSPILELEKNVRTMTFRAEVQLSVTGAFHNISADGGVSGDAVNLFANKKDYYYALISDGMGCGREAALTSNLCSVFLEKMLKAGNRAGTSLRMLNNMIRSRTSDSTRECSSTVDLVEIDLMTADAVFMKSGAAPSFVIRGSEVNRLQAGTAPIGIIRTLDVGSEVWRLRGGDTVVLVSDGILAEDPDCAWLSSYLSDAAKKTPEELVYHICTHAAAFERHDDCSAVALRIEEKE